MSRKSIFSDKNRVPYASRIDFAVSIVLAILNLVAYALIVTFTDVLKPIVLLIAFIGVYVAEIAIIGIRRASRLTVHPSIDINDLLTEESSTVLVNTKAPALIVNRHGVLLWYNEAMRQILPFSDSVIGNNVETLFDDETKAAMFAAERITVAEKLYSVEGFMLSEAEDGMYAMILSDVTALS